MDATEKEQQEAKLRCASFLLEMFQKYEPMVRREFEEGKVKKTEKAN